MKKTLSIFIWLIVLSIILQFLLLYMFPYTGLGRLITVPFSIFLSVLIAVIYYYGAKKYSTIKNNEIIVAIFSSVLIVFLNIQLFVQDSQITVWHQLSCYYQVFTDYDEIEYDDIFIPRDFQNYTREDCKYQKYIASLHKFQNVIPYDGSYKMYNENMKYYNRHGRVDPVLKSQSNIIKKLDLGADRIFFSMLELRYSKVANKAAQADELEVRDTNKVD